MAKDYSSHADYMARVSPEAKARIKEIEAGLRAAFGSHIESRRVEVIVFSDVSIDELANALLSHPQILKPLFAVCSLGGRGPARDLDVRNLNTYRPKLTRDKANQLAGYMKPFLPDCVEIPTIVKVDELGFLDKEIRKAKGGWETRIREAANKWGRVVFTKRKFTVDGQKFELDAAFPKTGDVRIGIDVKRIEARQDIHKRCDEIVNKAAKLSSVFPTAKFGAVIYYPFPTEHVNVQSRLKSSNIHGIAFAGDSDASIDNAMKLLLANLGVKAAE